MTDRQVSVVIPAYNAERYLGAALDSVLAQSHPPLEIIVIDDGSTDRCAEVVRSYPMVRCVRQQNAGQSAARNRGVEIAVGVLLAFLDADDLWTPDKLALQIAALAGPPQADIVFGHVEQFVDPVCEQRIKLPPGPLPAQLPGAMLARRAAFDRIGPFRSDLAVAEVVDWYARASDSGLRIVTVPQIVLRRRIHDDNLGIRRREAGSDYLRALRSALDRRRTTTGSRDPT